MNFTSFMLFSAMALVAAMEDGSDGLHKLRIQVAQPEPANFEPKETGFDFGFLRGGGSSSSADENCNQISSKSKREECKSRKNSNRSNYSSKSSKSSSSKDFKDEFIRAKDEFVRAAHGSSKSDKSSSSSSSRSSSKSSKGSSSSRDYKCNEISNKSKREACKKRKNTSSEDFVRIA